jgi:hypothetical protein
MAKKESKPWYKRGWFYAAIILTGLVLIGIYLGKIQSDSKLFIERQELTSQYNKTFWEINAIENKYVKDGTYLISDFSDSDLDDYLKLLNEQKQNYDQIINWIIQHVKYLKSQGESDLLISENLNELRSGREQVSEAQMKASNVRSLRDALNQ